MIFLTLEALFKLDLNFLLLITFGARFLNIQNLTQPVLFI